VDGRDPSRAPKGLQEIIRLLPANWRPKSASLTILLTADRGRTAEQAIGVFQSNFFALEYANGLFRLHFTTTAPSPGMT
jgi:hypothetical protein